jgi:hypothetical protein
MEARWRKSGAGEGNRTLVLSLGSSCSTIELHPREASVSSTAKGKRKLQILRPCGSQSTSPRCLPVADLRHRRATRVRQRSILPANLSSNLYGTECSSALATSPISRAMTSVTDRLPSHVDQRGLHPASHPACALRQASPESIGGCAKENRNGLRLSDRCLSRDI